jgi:hypothetical protein
LQHASEQIVAVFIAYFVSLRPSGNGNSSVQIPSDLGYTDLRQRCINHLYYGRGNGVLHDNLGKSTDLYGRKRWRYGRGAIEVLILPPKNAFCINAGHLRRSPKPRHGKPIFALLVQGFSKILA